MYESRWEIPKGYWEASGKCLNTSHQPREEEAALPSGYQQKIW
jgi:hypothetical protein